MRNLAADKGDERFQHARRAALSPLLQRLAERIEEARDAGQVDAEIVLQNPVRIYGLLAFFAAVALAQIMLVLKKKRVEKVQAAEGNF